MHRQAQHLGGGSFGADRMGRAAVGGQRRFQLGHLRPENEFAVLQHGLNPLIDVASVTCVLASEIDEGQGLLRDHVLLRGHVSEERGTRDEFSGSSGVHAVSSTR